MVGHPEVVSAAYLEGATGYSVGRIKAEMLPMCAEGELPEALRPRAVEEQEVASLIGRLRVPFYERGEVSARVRQAKQNQQGRVIDIEWRARGSRRRWRRRGRNCSANSKLVSDNEQVASTQIALDGVREEEKVGQRTLLECSMPSMICSMPKWP